MVYDVFRRALISVRVCSRHNSLAISNQAPDQTVAVCHVQMPVKAFERWCLVVSKETSTFPARAARWTDMLRDEKIDTKIVHVCVGWHAPKCRRLISLLPGEVEKSRRRETKHSWESLRSESTETFPKINLTSVLMWFGFVVFTTWQSLGSIDKRTGFSLHVTTQDQYFQIHLSWRQFLEKAQFYVVKNYGFVRIRFEQSHEWCFCSYHFTGWPTGKSPKNPFLSFRLKENENTNGWMDGWRGRFSPDLLATCLEYIPVKCVCSVCVYVSYFTGLFASPWG